MKYLFSLILLAICSCTKQRVQNCSCESPPVIDKFEGGYVFMPNIFTPDHNGINDILSIKSQGITSLSLKIKNDVGKVIYHADYIKAFDQYWNGNNESDSKRILGLFKYELKYTTISGLEKQHEGKVAVMDLESKTNLPFYIDCIKHRSACVFGSQWANDSASLLNVDQSYENVPPSCE